MVIALTVGPDSGAWAVLPGLIIIGVASGATFAPLQQATMDGVDPRLAGAASGVSGTVRQIGGVLGTAALGALLSARLDQVLRDEAVERAPRLPADLRAEFIDATAASARRFSPPSAPDGLAPADTALFERPARRPSPRGSSTLCRPHCWRPRPSSSSPPSSACCSEHAGKTAFRRPSPKRRSHRTNDAARGAPCRAVTRAAPLDKTR